jgi:lipid-binding SYLF domain-containing protein
MTKTMTRLAVLAMTVALALASVPQPAAAASGAEIEKKASAALEQLYATTEAAKKLSSEATGILVFPSIGKGGFVLAGSYGSGVLYKGGENAGFYNTAEVSYGFQAGIEKYAYALFFMTDDALKYLDKSGGFELGAGPSLTVVDAGIAKGLGTTQSRDDIYGFVFGQKGLMGGVGLKGSKITRIHPKE